MIRRFAVAALRACLALAALPLAAQETVQLSDEMAATAAALREAGLGDARAYALIESLTTEVGPRLGGTEAEARARDWAAAELESLGFENVRVEPFAMEGWVRGRERAEVLGDNAQPLYITALGGSVATPEDGLEGAVVRFENLLALKSAAEGSLEGKIAFIDQQLYRTQDGSGYGTVVPIRRDGASEAAKKGAIAVVIRSVGTDEHRFPHTGQMRYAEDVARIPAGALSNPDADQLARLLERGPTRLKLVLTPAFTGTVTSGNVIGEIVGRERPEEIVLLGAHLDSWDLGTGAVDDGAGVGIVTAAAKLVADRAGKPRRTIRVVLFGAEEVGLKGAFAYAKQHAESLSQHVVAAESDFGAGPIWRFDTRFGEDALGFAAAIHRQLLPLGIGRGPNDARGGPDLIPIRNEGVPVVTLYQDGRDYFDLHHTPDDTFDKVELEKVRQNVAAYAVFAYLAANLDVDFRGTAGGEASAP